MPDTTAKLLAIWRSAERTRIAARQTAEAALAAAQAADAAAAAAEAVAAAARQAALDAGVSLDAADETVEATHKAYVDRQDEQRDPTPPSGATPSRAR